MNLSSSLITLFAASFLLLSSAWAEETPAERLQGTVNSVLDVLSSTELDYEGKRAQVRETLQTQFSFDAMIKGALGRNRSQLTEEELSHVTALVTDLLISAYLREFSDGERPVMTFKKAVELTKNKIEVPSVIKIDGKDINLSYRLARLQSGWQVYDLIVEGVSMVRNYREQFDQHFQTKGVPELIELIKKKIQDF